MTSGLFRAFERIGIWLVYAGMICLSGTVVLSMVDIVGRKTIGFSVFGIDDLVSLTVMACISLAMPLTYLREGHVAVEFVTDGLRPRILAGLKAFTTLATTVFVACLAWFAFKQAQLQMGQGDQSNTLAIPIVYFWVPLLVGLTASVLCALLLVFRWARAAFGTGGPT